MSISGEFLTYCIELYATERNLDGTEVYNLFHETNTIEYILKNYEVLHTLSDELVIEYIDGYIAAEGREVLSNV